MDGKEVTVEVEETEALKVAWRTNVKTIKWATLSGI
jgi:hypothetical protein